MEYSTETGTYVIFTEFLQLNFGVNFGENEEKLRRKSSEKLMLILVLIAIEKGYKSNRSQSDIRRFNKNNRNLYLKIERCSAY